MQVVVATHGHCFDGLASAVLFTELHRRLLATPRGPSGFRYHACGYGSSPHALEPLLLGDENAILDYRLCPSPRLTWFFDHHRTGVSLPEDRAFLAQGQDRERFFFAPDFSSCAKLIAEVALRHFGVDLQRPELVAWADRIDSAHFSGPEEALLREDPIQRFASVVEHHADDPFLTRMVEALLARSLPEVAESREVKSLYRPLRLRRRRLVKQVQKCARRLGRVVLVDLTESPSESAEKFVTYALYPDSVYSVVVGRTKSDVNISVGYNPWCGKPLDLDISAICVRHGGGGHAVVGGIALAIAELEQARTLAHSIAIELDG